MGCFRNRLQGLPEQSCCNNIHPSKDNAAAVVAADGVRGGAVCEADAVPDGGQDGVADGHPEAGPDAPIAADAPAADGMNFAVRKQDGSPVVVIQILRKDASPDLHLCDRARRA